MKTMEEYIDWFRVEAESLHWQARERVLNSIDTKNPRSIFTSLDKLYEEGELSEAWNEVLTDFYGLFCY